jgi:hypothetical protein
MMEGVCCGEKNMGQACLSDQQRIEVQLMENTSKYSE